jgi:hypothetical protein
MVSMTISQYYWVKHRHFIFVVAAASPIYDTTPNTHHDDTLNLLIFSMFGYQEKAVNLVKPRLYEK